jgi:hypothetical protein
MMNEAKRRKLESKGWSVGGAQEFLGLSDAKTTFIEFKLKLARSLRAKRLKRGRFDRVGGPSRPVSFDAGHFRS